jgi:hypothetical protein
MKNTCYFLMVFIFYPSLHAQPGSWDACDITNSLYEYNREYIDLGSLTHVAMLGIPMYYFKTCSPYRDQFGDYTKGTAARLGNTKFEIINQQELKITFTKDEFIIPNDCEGGSAYYNNDFLVQDETGVNHIHHCDASGYTIIRYDGLGNEINRTTISGDWIDRKGNSTHYKTHRILKNCTRNQLIFYVDPQVDPNKTGTLILDLVTHQITEYPAISCGYAIDETGNSAGLFYSLDKYINFQQQGSAKIYHIPFDAYYRNVIGVIRGDHLVIATYVSNATGSSLLCYNLKKDRLQWTADVQQLMISHSKYANRVYLSSYKNKIILEGQESGGSYLQIFDLYTGKRLWKDLKKTW